MDPRPNSGLAALLAEARLGLSADSLPLTDRHDLRQASIALARQAHRRIRIFSHELEPACYDHPELVAAVKELALRLPDVGILILVQDNERLRQGGHRLVELATRLPSRISIHRPHLAEHLRHRENFMLVDDDGLVHQPLYSRPEGTVCFHDPMRVRDLDHFFHEMWDQSEPDVLLRRLSI